MDIDKIIKEMTLEDKIALCSGESFWETKKYEKYGIPSLFMCDGPHGLRKQENASDMLGVNISRPATCFPSEVTTAGSWDPKLLEEVGKAIGEEAHDQGVGLVLGPGANIKRNPLCGRNFEYFSEDPYLAGKLAAGFIRGAESTDTATSLKHFAANSQEYCRFNTDSIIDERTLREVYLTAFEIAVKEGSPSTVMCAYPKINGIHCSDNKELLTDILRDEWGFDGLVVTDWGGMNDRIKGFKAGCDLNMPGGSSYMEKDAQKALKNNTLSEDFIDESVRRILNLVFKEENALKEVKPADYESHHRLAKRAAVEGAVLLKNDDNILPLKPDTRIAVIGAMAKDMRYQGAGSSHINPTKLNQPLDYLSNYTYASGCDEKGNTDEDMLYKAEAAAKNAETAVIFAGLPSSYESEGFDRENMEIPKGQLQLIEAVSAVNSNTVVILFSGSAIECPFADKVKAIIYMGLPGQSGGEAVADILYGKANPCGKLAESWPYSYHDVPSSEIYDRTKDALYMEGPYIGYRYYDKAGIKVRWPFGYGLSYTSFAYEDLKISGNKVSVNVRNTGKYEGAEVVQLYISSPQDGIHRPIKELKGFKKVFLEPMESCNVEFTLTDRCFSVWQDGWKVPSGIYNITVGNLSSEIRKDGEEITVPAWQDGSWYENCKGKPDKDDWEKMLGRKYNPEKLKKGSFTIDNTVIEMKDFSLVMKIMYKAVESTIAKGFGGKKDYENPEFRMLMNSSAGAPLRTMMISGGIKGGVLPGMLEMANGHFIKGIIKMIKG